MLSQHIEQIVENATIEKRFCNFFLILKTQDKLIYLNEVAPKEEMYATSKVFHTKFGAFSDAQVQELVNKKVICDAREKEDKNFFFTSNLKFEQVDAQIKEEKKEAKRLKCEKCHCFISKSKEHVCKK